LVTFEKLSGQISTLCGVDGNCNSVLTGPYSTVPFTDIPLSLMGFLAYVSVAFLALQPLSQPPDADDTSNRVVLTSITTAMATFSAGLMLILFGVLQTTCPYCVFSAACSIILAKLAWIGGCLPKGNRAGAPAAAFMASTVAAAVLFVSNEDISVPTPTLLATASTPEKLYSPPSITTESSTKAIELASELEKLDAKMYGAYWCSHCYDQKEVFGRQAYQKIQYIECSKDGVNSQTKLCRQKEVPGYPTWEIQGQLYPGQQELEELEDLVKTIKSAGSAST